MEPPLAQPSDVEDIWRPLTQQEQLKVTNLIAKASAKLRFAGRDLNIDQRIEDFSTSPDDPDALDPIIVADVVAKIVKRALINPDGKVSESETEGDYAYTDSYPNQGANASGGGLEVLQSDLDALRPGRSVMTVGSIRLKAGMAPPALYADHRTIR